MEDIIEVQLCIRDFDFFDAFLNTANEMVNDERIDEAIRNEYKEKFEKLDDEAVEEIEKKKAEVRNEKGTI